MGKYINSMAALVFYLYTIFMPYRDNKTVKVIIQWTDTIQ